MTEPCLNIQYPRHTQADFEDPMSRPDSEPENDVDVRAWDVVCSMSTTEITHVYVSM